MALAEAAVSGSDGHPPGRQPVPGAHLWSVPDFIDTDL